MKRWHSIQLSWKDLWKGIYFIKPVTSPRSPRRRRRQGKGQAMTSVNSPSPRPVPSPRSSKRRRSREGAGEGFSEFSKPSDGRFTPVSEAESKQGRNRRGPQWILRALGRSLRPALRGGDGAGEGLGEFSEPSTGPFAPLSEAETEKGRGRRGPRWILRGPRPLHTAPYIVEVQTAPVCNIWFV